MIIYWNNQSTAPFYSGYYQWFTSRGITTHALTMYDGITVGDPLLTAKTVPFQQLDGVTLSDSDTLGKYAASLSFDEATQRWFATITPWYRATTAVFQSTFFSWHATAKGAAQSFAIADGISLSDTNTILKAIQQIQTDAVVLGDTATLFVAKAATALASGDKVLLSDVISLYKEMGYVQTDGVIVGDYATIYVPSAVGRRWARQVRRKIL